MKRFALLLASVAFVTPALAADVIYEEPPAPAPMAEAAPLYNWSGFYVGAQAGVAFNRDSGAFSSSNSSFNGKNDDSETGFIGGGHVGYDYQFSNNFVLGAVADLNYIDAEARSNFNVAGPNGGQNFSADQDINYVGTVRAKAGYAMDRFMVYATGGLAYADIDSNVNGVSGTNAFTDGAGNQYDVSKRSHSDDVGYAVGAGVDVLATQNVSFGLEYLYTDLGKTTNKVNFDTVGTANDFSATSKTDLDYHSVMAKASYHFN